MYYKGSEHRNFYLQGDVVKMEKYKYTSTCNILFLQDYSIKKLCEVHKQPLTVGSIVDSDLKFDDFWKKKKVILESLLKKFLPQCSLFQGEQVTAHVQCKNGFTSQSTAVIQQSSTVEQINN